MYFHISAVFLCTRKKYVHAHTNTKSNARTHTQVFSTIYIYSTHVCTEREREKKIHTHIPDNKHAITHITHVTHTHTKQTNADATEPSTTRTAKLIRGLSHK